MNAPTEAAPSCACCTEPGTEAFRLSPLLSFRLCAQHAREWASAPESGAAYAALIDFCNRITRGGIR